VTSAPSPAAGFSWRILGLVVLGGALGAMARAALLGPATLDPLLAAGSTAASLATTLTVAINVVGSLGLGVVVGVMGSRHPQARAFLGTGVLGGFTTFSAFAVQVVTSTPWLAVLLALCTLVLGVIAAGAGLRIGRALGHRRGSTDAPEQAE